MIALPLVCGLYGSKDDSVEDVLIISILPQKTTDLLRIKLPLLDRYADLLREQLNWGAVHYGKRLMWDTVMLRKCQKLAQYLLKKTRSVNFADLETILCCPECGSNQTDSRKELHLLAA